MDYRKIWRDAFGPIPKDEDGRSYDIHHIDGNKNNNDLSNLMCVSIKEHYEIHYKQKDWMSAHAVSLRMKLSNEDRLDIIKKMAESKKGKKGVDSDETRKKKARPGSLNGMYGKKHSPESIELMKKNRMGKGLGRHDRVYPNNFKPMYGDKNPASKSVSQYDLDGNFISSYKTIKEASEITGANNISAVCRGMLKNSGGYIWKYN